jgi:PDZ domain-containing protein
MTVLIGLGMIIGLVFLVGLAPVPYVQMEPGPTFNTLGNDDQGKPVIVVTGATETKSVGQLRFVTIGAQSHLTLLQALVGWWNDEDAVVPRELIYGNETDQQVEQRSAEDFQNSQSAAETAAEIALGYPIKVTVKEVAAGTPADGKLKAGDVITAVNGTKIDSAERLLSVIRSNPAGTQLSIEITRGGATETVTLASYDDNGTPRVGFSPDATPTAPFKFDVPIENIGGPSAGLMLTLGMIDKIDQLDLTGGKIIAGTGTIDALGNVGPIGGIPQKLVSAKAAGATYFLTPKDNCAEALSNQKPGMRLVEVSSLSDALAALSAIRSGSQPPTCTS